MADVVWAHKKRPPPVPVVPRERIKSQAERDMEARIAAERAQAWADGFRAGETAATTDVTIDLGGIGCTFSSRPGALAKLREICEQVAHKHGISLDDLMSQRRGRGLIIARQEAMWRCKTETPHSYPTIGKFLGGRDHTTVLHGVRRHEERLGVSRMAQPT